MFPFFHPTILFPSSSLLPAEVRGISQMKCFKTSRNCWSHGLISGIKCSKVLAGRQFQLELVTRPRYLFLFVFGLFVYVFVFLYLYLYFCICIRICKCCSRAVPARIGHTSSLPLPICIWTFCFCFFVFGFLLGRGWMNR